jgi:hypothetical protein
MHGQPGRLGFGDQFPRKVRTPRSQGQALMGNSTCQKKAQRLLVQEDYIIKEDGAAMPFQVLAADFSAIYIVDVRNSVVMNSKYHGQAYDRTRRITIMKHKRTQYVSPEKVLTPPGMPSFTDFELLCRRVCNYDWTLYACVCVCV